MLGHVLESHQVDDIDEPDAQVREVLAKDVDRREGLQRRDVAARPDDDVRFTLVITRPVPDPEPAAAVRRRVFHREVRQCRLLAGDDHVHIVPTSQTVIGGR